MLDGASRTVVLLVTNNFPFGKGEEFIAPEVPRLAAAVDELVVLATKCGSDPQTRALPANGRALRIDGGRPHGSLLPELAGRGAVGLVRAGRLRPRGVREMAADLVFEGQARRAVQRLAAQLDEVGLRAGDRVVLYAYWLHTPARVAELTRDLVRDRRPEVEVTLLVSRAHGYDLYLEAAPFGHLPQRRELIAAMDRIRPISQRGADYLTSHWPASRGKVRVARLGTADPGGRAEPQQRPVELLTVGGLVGIKRTERMPGILAALKARGIEAGWTHWGDGASREQLRDEAAAVVGPGRVHLDGSVPHSEMLPRHVAGRFTCLVNTSSSEGLPVSMMEAFSVGLPVVGTRVGGVAEIVTDGVDGRLVDPDFTDDEMAAVIAEVAQMDEGAYRAMCDAARQRWQTDYDEAVNGDAFVRELVS